MDARDNYPDAVWNIATDLCGNPSLAAAGVRCLVSPPRKAELERGQMMVDCPSAYVVDGDTLRCGSERLRLLEIDAPERSESSSGGKSALLAMAERLI